MGVTTSGKPTAAERSGWTTEPTPRAARGRRTVAVIGVLALLGAATFLARALLPLLPASAISAGSPAPSLATTQFTSRGEPVRIPVTAATRVSVMVPPARGSAKVDGTDVVYTPRADHIGQDRLSVSVCSGERCSAATVQVRTGRPGLSALTSVATQSVIRRADQPLQPGARISGSVPSGTTAVAVSVTVTRAIRTGEVTVDGGAGPVTALRVAQAGATTTNLVIVPVAGSALTAVTRPGGGLTVDIVGTFTTADTARAGRFVPVKQTRVVSLTTTRDGRTATVDPASFGAEAGIRAVLALVTAKIGTNPAWVDLGGEPGQIDRTMSWGPASGSFERRGLALIPVNGKGQFSLRYEHGSRIDVDVLGYFTGKQATDTVAGLYVPRTPATVFDGVARAHGDRIEAPAPAAAVFLNLRGESGVTGRLPARDVGIASGRTIGTTLPAADGKTEIRASRPLSVRATLLGYFVAGK
jgi:hypothetical protein